MVADPADPPGDPSGPLTFVSLDIVESLTRAMYRALLDECVQHPVSPAELFSSTFTLTLRIMQGAISLVEKDPGTEFALRAQLSMLCEKLWVAAAGEPFVRDVTKKDKARPN